MVRMVVDRRKQNGVKLAGGSLVALCIGILLLSCEKDSLSPAKSLEGSWSSVQSTYFLGLSDSCVGYYTVYDSTPIILHWNITYTKENIVDIQVQGSATSEPITLPGGCSPPHQYKFPESLHGVVGSTYMVVEKAYYPSDTAGLAYLPLGKFYFDQSSMSGGLTYLYCDTLRCRGYMTRAGAIVLKKD